MFVARRSAAGGERGGRQVHREPTAGLGLQVRPATVRAGDVLRPADSLLVRGRAGETGDCQVRPEPQTPVEPLHAPLQLQHQQASL